MARNAGTNREPQRELSFQRLDNSGDDIGAFPTKPSSSRNMTKTSKRTTPEYDGSVSETENMEEGLHGEDRTLPISPDSSFQQPSESQTYDAESTQLELMLPSDVKQQLDDMSQASPFKSSTVRFHEQEHNVTKDQDPMMNISITALSVASTSSMETRDASPAPASPLASEDRSDLAEEEEENPNITVLSIASTSTLTKQLNAIEASQKMDHDEENGNDFAIPSSDSSDVGIFTDEPDEDGPSTPLNTMFTDDDDNSDYYSDDEMVKSQSRSLKTSKQENIDGDRGGGSESAAQPNNACTKGTNKTSRGDEPKEAQALLDALGSVFGKDNE